MRGSLLWPRLFWKPPSMADPEKTGGKQAGKFRPGESGNPSGKPPGTRHKLTLAAEILLDGEAEALTRKAIDLALEGDTTALRLCLERIVPPRKSRKVAFDLPKIQKAEDLLPAFAAVVAAMGAGDLALDEAATVVGVLEAKRKAIETVDIEKRLAALELRSASK
jgi:Family of unknown function (DUF5681)